MGVFHLAEHSCVAQSSNIFQTRPESIVPTWSYPEWCSIYFVQNLMYLLISFFCNFYFLKFVFFWNFGVVQSNRGVQSRNIFSEISLRQWLCVCVSAKICVMCVVQSKNIFYQFRYGNVCVCLCCVLQDFAAHCIAMNCIARQCYAVHCRGVQFIALH